MDGDYQRKLEEIKLTEDVQGGFRLQKELLEMSGRTTNENEKSQLRQLLKSLEFFLLPYVSSDRLVLFLEKGLLEGLREDDNLKQRIEWSIAPYPEDSHDMVKLGILNAIIKNQERINDKNISEFFQDYEKFTGFKKGKSFDRMNFIKTNESARNLNPNDQKLLLAVLDLFDLLKPDFDYKDKLKFVTTTKVVSGKITATGERINLPLSQALQRYPRVGEQLVTGSPIKLKIFPEPVRPSVRNWIADYHQVLGAGAHGTMERGNFLYHSENAKRLTARERQKLAVVLKSLDEDETVSIDIDKQEIMFSLQPMTDNLQQTTPDKIPNSNDQKPSWPASISWKRGEQPRSATSDQQPGVKFSYPQRLQSERPQRETYQHYDPYQIIPTGYPEDKPGPEPPKPPPPRQTPPLPPRSEPRISGNVVDLRN